MLIIAKAGNEVIKRECNKEDFSIQITYFQGSRFTRSRWHLCGFPLDFDDLVCEGQGDDILDLTLEGFPPIKKQVEVIDEGNRYFPAPIPDHKNHYDLIFEKNSEEKRNYHFTFLPEYGLDVYLTCNK